MRRCVRDGGAVERAGDDRGGDDRGAGDDRGRGDDRSAADDGVDDAATGYDDHVAGAAPTDHRAAPADDSGAGETTSTVVGTIPPPTLQPTGLGDDPTLDALAQSCYDGDLEACDNLWRDSDDGSAYRNFGDTCAGRQPPNTGIWCADAFAGAYHDHVVRDSDDDGPRTDGAADVAERKSRRRRSSPRASATTRH